MNICGWYSRDEARAAPPREAERQPVGCAERRGSAVDMLRNVKSGGVDLCAMQPAGAEAVPEAVKERILSVQFMPYV